MKKLTILVLSLLLTLSFTACGGDAAETTAPTTVTEVQTVTELPELGLLEWSMNATTWSSPNGATVNLTATPSYYAETNSASFLVRLEGEDVENIPCEWDGSHYTASAELNAADGYCYYVVLTDANGTVEVAVNTPTNTTDETLINMETALNSYCNVMVESSTYENGTLTVTGGYAQIQLTRITQASPVTAKEAVLVLTFEDEEVARETLTLPEIDADGSYEVEISGVSFKTPAMEDDQQLNLRLDVTSSDGQFLTAPAGTWFYNDGDLLLAVG